MPTSPYSLFHQREARASKPKKVRTSPTTTFHQAEAGQASPTEIHRAAQTYRAQVAAPSSSGVASAPAPVSPRAQRAIRQAKVQAHREQVAVKVARSHALRPQDHHIVQKLAKDLGGKPKDVKLAHHIVTQTPPHQRTELIHPTKTTPLPRALKIHVDLPPKVRAHRLEVRQARKLARKPKRQAKRRAKRIVHRPLATLDPQQSRVAKKVLTVGVRRGATPKELMAAAETGLVESDFRNLSYGDASSQGWRQEQTSIYGGGPKGPRNVKASARRFFSELRSDPGTAGAPTPGLLAQAAQGSAFPARYDETAPQAGKIVGSYLHKVKVAKKAGLPLGKVAEKAPKKVVSRFKAIQKAAGALDKQHLPYVWGGGHGGGPADPKASGGLDCSSTVSWVLQKAGYKIPTITSGSFGSYVKPGPGAVTVFYNSEHVFMRIGNRYFGTSHANPGGGPGWIPTSYEQGEATSGKYSVGHVPGLGAKQAVQLGFGLTGATGTSSLPGMTVSGTSATIESGVTKDKPGFSSKPIRGQKYRKPTGKQILAKLASVGAGIGGAETEGPAVPTLESLKRSKAPVV